jgi:hypothetical protein
MENTIYLSISLATDTNLNSSRRSMIRDGERGNKILGGWKGNSVIRGGRRGKA